MVPFPFLKTFIIFPSHTGWNQSPHNALIGPTYLWSTLGRQVVSHHRVFQLSLHLEHSSSIYVFDLITCLPYFTIRHSPSSQLYQLHIYCFFSPATYACLLLSISSPSALFQMQSPRGKDFVFCPLLSLQCLKLWLHVAGTQLLSVGQLTNDLWMCRRCTHIWKK